MERVKKQYTKRERKYEEIEKLPNDAKLSIEKAERDKKIIDQYEAIIDADCSTWRKYCIVAETVGVTPAHVSSIIRNHNEQSDNQSN